MQCEKFKFLKTNAKWYLIKSEWNESWMDMKFSRYFLINFSKLIIFHEINPFVLFSSAIWPNLSPRYSAIFRESHSRNYFKWPSNCSKLRICSFLSLSLLLFRKTPSNKMFVIKLRCSTFFFFHPRDIFSRMVSMKSCTFLSRLFCRVIGRKNRISNPLVLSSPPICAYATIIVETIGITNPD